MDHLSKAIRSCARVFLVVALFSAATNVLILTSPLYLLQIYDRVLVSRSQDTLMLVTIVALLALAVFGLLEMVRGMLISRAASRLEAVAGGPVLESMLTNQRASVGDTQPMRDLQSLRGLVASRSSLNLVDLPFAPMFLAIIFLIHPSLGWLSVGGAVILLALTIGNELLTARIQLRSSDAGMLALRTAQAPDEKCGRDSRHVHGRQGGHRLGATEFGRTRGRRPYSRA